MSCEWDVVCLDCMGQNKMGLHANHGVEFIRAVIANADALAALDKLAQVEPSIDLRSTHGYLSTSWMAIHHKHRLVAVDEYGRRDGDCGEPFVCSECSASHTCKKPAKHDGDHGKREKT